MVDIYLFHENIMSLRYEIRLYRDAEDVVAMALWGSGDAEVMI